MSGKHPEHEHHRHAGASHGHREDPPTEPHDAGTNPASQIAGADEASAETSTVAEELAAKDKEIADLKDKYLRALADFENSRKRMRQQGEDSARIQKENLLREILPMLDNLERALEAARAAAGAEAIVAGVEMVARSMLDFLRTHGVAQQSAVGRQFDPALHEAIAQIPTDAHPLNSVVEEFHRGYQIGDRVLRPARVSVAAAPSSGRNKGENASSDVEND